jgi:hypothetical protein
VKNDFEKALRAKQARLAKQTGALGGKTAGRASRTRDAAERVKNGKILGSTRADKK